jgi:hypothetical protein
VTLRVVVEVAAKRAFASALDWPGWARSGGGEEEALEALLAYGPRYAAVAKRARVSFKPPATARGLSVVERLTGGGTTDFGAPGEAAHVEDEPISAADAKRLTALLRAAWATFDAVRARAVGVELTKGPRGGGRDLDKIVEHVREAEVAYLRQLGSRPPPGADRAAGGLDAIRNAFVDALAARVHGEPLPNPRKTKKPWLPRYAIRRSAWHALDHAWEIEDRSA